MAKQNQRTIQSYYQGANAALIKGAGLVYGTQNQPASGSGIDFSSQIQSLSSGINAARNQAELKKAAVQKEANEAYSALSNMSFEGMLPSMYDSVQAQLLPVAKEIASLKMEMSSTSDSEQKALIQSEINKKTALITNFTTQIKDLSTNAIKQLDYNRSEDRSEANDDDYVSAINKIFSGQSVPLMVDGQLAFDVNGELTKYSDLKNITPKAYEEFTAYSDAVGNATRAQDIITQQQTEAFQSKMFSQITPDNIVSLGMDNFGTGKRILGDQFATIQDWQSFVNENYGAAKQLLANRLTENYVNTYNNSAEEYKRKNPAKGGRSGGSGSTNTDYQNRSSNRLFTAIAQGGGFGNSMETEEIYMPGNASARKYKTQWSPNGITFMAKGGKFYHPITGEEVVEATIGWADAAEIWGFDTSQIPFLNSSDNLYNEEGTGPATTVDPEQRQRNIDAGNLVFRGVTPGAARPGVLNNLGKTN